MITILKKSHERALCKKGIGLVEIVIGAAILTSSVLAIATFYVQALGAGRDATQLVQASFLAEEGLEVMRFFRDESWQNISGLTTGTSYYLTFNGTKWATTTTDMFIDSTFERAVKVENVYRDLSDDIASSGGTLDANTKKITASVSWRNKTATTTRSIATYMTNIFSN